MNSSPRRSRPKRGSPSSPPIAAPQCRWTRRFWSCPMCSAALRALAAAARARTQAKVIGVTGSVGKTSTKEALRLALAKDGETHASVASYNNHWGVPLSLARCPASAHYAVLEMGMNHAGEIEPLSRLARPHVAVITAIAPVHLEFFGTLAKIADAKAEIFLGLDANDAAVLNRDNAQFAPSDAPCEGSRRRARRVVRRAREGRGAPDQIRAACRVLDRPRRHPRHRTDLQDRHARPPSRAQFARGAGDGRARRRRPRAWRRWRCPNSSPPPGAAR